jgi:hypothetical protein
MDLMTQVAFQCVRSEQLMELELAKDKTDRSFVTHYDDVCDSPREIISEIADWLGVTFKKRKHSKLPDRFQQSKSAYFTEEQARLFRSIASSMHTDKDKYIESVNLATSRYIDSNQAK